MVIHYTRLWNYTSTKPVDIYEGTQKIGVVQGQYKNIFTRLMDQLGDNKIPFIGYQLKDNNGKLRFTSKNASGFGLRKLRITYLDNKDREHQFLMKDIKMDLVEKRNKIIFEYNGDTYYLIQSRMFDRDSQYEITCDDNVIAEWTHLAFSHEVTINIIEPAFFNDKYLIIGVFHAYFYPIKH